MAKPICVHCQERPGDTRDHVLPDAWYPTTTPTTVQQWTVPCCRPCNERLHRAEDAIGLDLLLICMMDRPEIAGVQEKIFRAWNAAHARDAEDASHRASKGQRILRTMEWPEPADDVLTIDDFPPELVEAIRNAPRFEMFGPGSRSPGRCCRR